MKHLLVVSVAALALLMIGCDRASSIAGPQGNSLSSPSFDALHNTTNEMDVPWGDVEKNPCTGDEVTVAGTTHYIFLTTDDGSGGFHLTTDAYSRGAGAGFPSLFTYTEKDYFSYVSQSLSRGGSIHQEMDLMILGPRSVDNYIKHMVMRVALDTNGVPTASVDNSYQKCVG